ncbi:hypothetical protein LG200_05035 [Methylobacillus caricis]|uniref:hypothetical protein n=1 Tax=Methylobacillus caricis TaxID=1971611 RepID=UPI001D000C16|nr:hypothetical protein [Methylobacillus caricis]MCB5187368.1 hypothetical protein [Methylobacillus caricis]
MVARVSAAERAQLSNRAEVEIMRYKDDHAMWHKHVHNVDLDPVQVLKCIEMDQHPDTIDVSCRRTGKTAVKEMHALKYLATTPAQELGIVAPRLQQSQTNLNYHIEAIRRSPMLDAYVDYKAGRKQLSDTKYSFVNKSKASSYGIMSQIDGDALSYASIEEVDDMPADRLLSRFMPMLGSARRLGASSEISFKPQVRVTGVFKGADVIQQLLDSGNYHMLPVLNVYLGIEMGILNASFMHKMRQELPEGEFIRQFLCKNVSAQNHIWEKFIRKAMSVGLQAGLQIAEPMPGMRYKRRGLISFGYDHTGHGESTTASKSALVVTEQIGNFITFPFVKSWPAGIDDKVIEGDLFSFWDYFRPDYAIGDAYGVGMLTNLNDRLYARGLTHIDRRTIGDGQSTGSTWSSWAFAPIRFEGMVKHSMAGALRAAFHNGQAAIPYFDDSREIAEVRDSNVIWVPGEISGVEGPPDWVAFVRQLGNIKSLPTKSSYASYKQANIKIGDDLFDAAMASVWGLNVGGIADEPAVITHRKQTREQLMGIAPRLGMRA